MIQSIYNKKSQRENRKGKKRNGKECLTPLVNKEIQIKMRH